jgi:hypothetical protein
MMETPKPNGGSFAATIKADELMNRTFVTDAMGNVFSLPIGPQHNAALEAGIMPEGFELVFATGGVNPKYRHVVAGAGILFQMVEAAKTLIEAHGEHLMSVGTPALMEAGVQFEAMAANLNLAQRQAIEGLQAMVAQTAKYQK